MIDQHDIEFAKTIMPAYIDTAKMFSQLSVGALVISIGFQEKVLGRVGRKFLTVFLIVSWFLFLIAIGSGAVYQWTAVHYMDYYLSGQPEFEDFYGRAWWVFFMQPGVWYATMMVAFFLGALLLVIGSAQQLYSKEAQKRAN